MAIYYGKDKNGIYNFHDDRVSIIENDYVKISQDEWDNIQKAISQGGTLKEKNKKPIVVDYNNSKIDINNIKDNDFYGKPVTTKDEALLRLSWIHEQASLATAMGQTFSEKGKEYVTIIKNIISGIDVTTTKLPDQPEELT